MRRDPKSADVTLRVTHVSISSLLIPTISWKPPQSDGPPSAVRGDRAAWRPRSRRVASLRSEALSPCARRAGRRWIRFRLGLRPFEGGSNEVVQRVYTGCSKG